MGPVVERRISEGLTPYEQAPACMEARVAAILAGEAGDVAWLLHHPPRHPARAPWPPPWP